jgi:uncharacterized protein YfaS (alpha-2-macroglobulin family)
MCSIFPLFPRPSTFRTGLALLALAVLAVGCRPSATVSSGVELVPATDPLNSASTFEVRFDAPMVAAAAVGDTNARPPIAVQPRLRGAFQWTSQRGGTFTPGEPLALGAAYTFTLRDGLTNAAGQVATATLRRTLHTPGFAFVEAADVPREGDCPASVSLRLLFNAPIEPAAAVPFIEFRSADGGRVPAAVAQGRLADRRWGFSSGVRERWSWEEWFEAVHPKTVQPGSTYESTNPAPNLLLVSPRTPLPPGTNWTCVLAAGLPMRGGRTGLAREERIALGPVRPFALIEASAHNYVNRGRSLRFEFTRRLPEALLTNFADWLVISPAVSNLTAELWGARIALRGGFALQTPYAVQVRAGMPSADGSLFPASAVTNLAFEPVAPRLYFPAIETGQFASGRRTFPLLVMNVDRVRVRAKRLDDASVVHGLRGFGRVYSPDDYPRDQGFFEVDYELIPGHTIYDEDFPGTVEVDQAVTIPLDWSRILGPGSNGAVFLCAERVAGSSPLMRLPSKPLGSAPGRAGSMPVLPTNAPPPRPAGYTVPAPPGLGVEAMVQVTDLGVVWKTAADQMLAFVFSLQSGQPVPDAQVQLLTDESQPLATARTDASGLARLSFSTNSAWLVARQGGDALALELSKSRLGLWSFDLPRDYRSEGERDERVVHLFTDRDLYRPGESIHLKGVVRDWQADTLALPATNRVTLTLRDYRDTVALSTNLLLSDCGTFDFSFAVPAEARQGRYDFQVTCGGADAWHGVHVLDFKPRAFEIQLGARPAYAASDAVSIPVAAKYLFGKPLDRAKVRWTLQFEDRPPEARAFAGFSFARCWRESSLGRGTASGTLTGELLLGGTNSPVLALEPGTNALAPQPRHTTLAVEVTDQNQQTLTHYAEFVRHSSDFYLGLNFDGNLRETGNALQARAVAIAPDGRPCTNTVPATLRLMRLDWQTVRVLGAGGVAAYRSEPLVTNVFTREVTVQPPRLLPNQEHEAELLSEFTVANGGEYLLELSAADAAGRPVVCSQEFYIHAPREKLAWSYRNEVEIELVPDKAVYAPGDTATLLLKTPISGTALVTVERAGVRRVSVTRLEGNAPSVRVPILPGDAPNVAVLVTLLRGAADSTAKVKEPEYRQGARNLAVEDPAQRLRVTLAANATNYLPAAPVEVEAQVRDAAGAPVADAEVTLYAVDEGVLLMSDYKLPDLYAEFHRSRPVRVESGISLPLLLPEDPEQLHFQNKGYVAGGGGQEQVRRNFAACAFWNAKLSTDADGRVRVRFTAPDAITRYRVLAVALTKQHQFGGAEAPFSISKPLLIEPALPMFARRTDQLTARAVVLNQTDSAGEIEVSLTLDATATVLAGDLTESVPTRRVAVAPRGSAVVEFPLTFSATGNARWTWRAKFTGPNAPPFADAAQSTLAVLPPAPLLTERLAATVTGPTNLLARANPQLLRGKGNVTVTLANSRLVALADAVPSLLHYPYGCAEQTASTLLPWLVLRGTPTLAPLIAPGTNDADVAIRHGIRRLLDMRTQGGLSYWPGGGQAMPWATAYATLVLALAREDGVELPEQALKQLCSDLTDGLPAALTNRSESATGCLALYALAAAGEAQPAWHEQFFAQRGRLSGEARALLALAVEVAGGPAEMIQQLLTDRPALNPPALLFASAHREDALRLLAWVRYKADAPEVAVLVEKLVTRLGDPGYSTTQETAWALLALSAYAEECEAGLPGISGTLTWQGTNTAFSVDATNRLVRCQFSRTDDDTTPALVLAVPSGSRLFTRVALATVPPENQQAAQDHGFAIARTYTALGDANQALDLKSLRVGDRVLVALQIVVPQDADFLAVDDPLPGVLEGVLPEFRSVPGQPLPFAEDADGFSDYRELRADRVLFFGNQVPAGRYGVRYLARVRAAGTSTAPAAKVEAMYEPERFGLSSSQVLVARPVE